MKRKFHLTIVGSFEIIPTVPLRITKFLVWTDSLPTQSGREPLKPVLFYLTGSLFTTDYNQLISPEVHNVTHKTLE